MKDSTNLADVKRSAEAGTQQTSFRLPQDLHNRFRASLEDRDLKMTPVLHELVEGWIDKDQALKRAKHVLPYLSFLPVSAVVKDLKGRLMFGNGEFRRLIGAEHSEIVGKLPDAYVDDSKSADMIRALDKVVRDVKKPILCLEHLQFNRKPHARMAIRFPIPAEGDPELTGTLAFDLEQIENKTEFLSPKAGGRRTCPFETLSSTTPEAPFHCLKDFLSSMPAIATVKNLEGKLLCVNAEYTRVLGKERVNVENHFSTEIWPDWFADVIVAHDDIVRHTNATHASVENVPTRNGLRYRFNIRFPIFDSFRTDRKLDMTGTLGFDYKLLRRGVGLLKQHGSPARAYAMPASDTDKMPMVYP